MYGPMFQQPTLPEVTPRVCFRWYSCTKCLVLWRADEETSHCFVCGKWGRRGQHYQDKED